MIAYRGDHTLANKFSHGNAKVKSNFIKTDDNILQVKKRCNEHTSVEALFSTIKQDQLDALPEAHGQLMVRDSKQIENFRALNKQKYIISPCQLTNINLMSMYHLQDFIQLINSVHEFCAVLAHPETIKLANIILKASEKNPDLDQVISYDTTFDLGEFYVSTIVIKNIIVKKDKIFSVAFFVHNRKKTGTHKKFFDWIFDQICVPSSVPFVTDREHSIVSNIIGHEVEAEQLFYNCIAQTTFNKTSSCGAKETT